jgi:hypothetical protein
MMGGKRDVAVREQNRHFRERLNAFEIMRMIEETRHKLTDHTQTGT